MVRFLHKSLACLLIGSCMCFSLFGFIDAQSIDRFAYVVAIGIDTGSTNSLKISFQISVPSGESGGSSSGSSEQSSNVLITSVDCDTVDSGISLVNNYISKQLNLTNCKVIVFSEDIASRGLSKYIYTLMNDKEIRPNVDIVISKNDAKTFLENSEPTLEKLSARYYDVITNSSKYTGYTSRSTIGSYFSSIHDTFMQPSAVLGAVTNSSLGDNIIDMNGVSGYSSDSSYTSGQTPIENEKPSIVNMGMAVFYSDRLVGELNGIESICHLLVTNQLHSCYLTIPSPFDSEGSMDLYVQQNGRTKSKVSFLNGSPYIECKVKVKARILSLTEDSNYLSSENLEKIEAYANSYLENCLYEYLYKTSKVFHSDVAGFGKHAVTHFSTTDKWENCNWLDTYKDAFFHVNVQTRVASSYLLLKT